MFETTLLCFLTLSQAGGDLARLVEEALARNPEVLAARKRLEAARQKPAAEASLPEPMVSIGWASIGGPLPGQGLGREPMARAGLMASQTLPAPGKRSLRRRMALEEAGAAGQEYAAVERRVVAQLKSAWYRLHHAQEMLDVAMRSRALLERLHQIALARYQAGQGSQKELLEAQIRLTVLEAKEAALEQERRRSEAEITALRARPLEEPVPRPVVGEPREAMARLEDLYEKARLESPALAALRHQVRRAELGLQLARRESLPDVTVSAGYYNMGGMPPMFEVKVDIPLPMLRRPRLGALAAGQSHEAEAARAAIRRPATNCCSASRTNGWPAAPPGGCYGSTRQRWCLRRRWRWTRRWRPMKQGAAASRRCWGRRRQCSRRKKITTRRCGTTTWRWYGWKS